MFPIAVKYIFIYEHVFFAPYCDITQSHRLVRIIRFRPRDARRRNGYVAISACQKSRSHFIRRFVRTRAVVHEREFLHAQTFFFGEIVVGNHAFEKHGTHAGDFDEFFCDATARKGFGNSEF